MKKQIFIILQILTFEASICFTQLSSNFSFTYSLNFGTHLNKQQVKLNYFIGNDILQISISERIGFIFTDLGGRKNGLENRFAIGTLIQIGSQNTDHWLIDQNYLRKNALSYDYIFYYDTWNTSQRSGSFLLRLNKFEISTENDFFAGQGRDRFRTGNLSISYLNQNTQLKLAFNSWTGESRNAYQKELNGFKIKDLSEVNYGKTSHGILSLAFSQNYQQINSSGVPFSSTLQLGVDSELIRNYFQNELIHKLKFLPKSKLHKTPIYPMLDHKGYPTFNKSDRKKEKLYFQFGLNNSDLY